MRLARIISVTAFMVSSSMALAQDQRDANDETALSRYQVIEEGENIPTLKELEIMEDASRALFDAGKCDEALPKLAEFSSAANHVANIISQGLEPFYDASRDDQKTIQRRENISLLAQAESASNQLKRKRNEFFLLEAKCHFKEGDYERALPRLMRVLELVSGTDDSKLWKEAREMIWQIVGYSPV